MPVELNVVDIWKSIQGEGPYVGRPAVFIRLSDCNLRCEFCDTDFLSTREKMFPEQVLAKVKDIAGKASLVVITGGEPFLQDGVCDLAKLLVSHFLVQFETNGTIYPSALLPVACKVVCSPKPRVSVHEKWRFACTCLHKVDAWKYVVKAGKLSKDDIPEETDPPPAGAVVYLQPMDERDEEKNRENIKATVEACLRSGYLLSLQTHKIIGVV